MLDLPFSLVISAFFGGVLMFLAPCTLPLVPAFLASLVPRAQQVYKKQVIIKTILFSAGFTGIFVAFGVLTGFFGSQLLTYKLILSQIGGVLIIFFGLSLMQIIELPFLTRTFGRNKKTILDPSRVSTAPLLGALFALGWTPCAGPILASILLLATSVGTAVQGGVLLGIFSLGLAVPFIAIGALYAHTMQIFGVYEKYRKFISRVSGVFLIGLGILLVFGHSILMTQFGYSMYSFFGYTPICAYF